MLYGTYLKAYQFVKFTFKETDIISCCFVPIVREVLESRATEVEEECFRRIDTAIHNDVMRMTVSMRNSDVV